MTPCFYCKKFSSDKKQPFIRAGFAIPEGALLRGFHCNTCKHVGWFHKWCQNRLFVSFREQHSLSFSPPIKSFLPVFTPCEFHVSTELKSFISYSCYYTTVDYQRKHLLSHVKQQQLIVWTMIGLRKRFLEFNTNKIPHSTSAV